MSPIEKMGEPELDKVTVGIKTSPGRSSRLKMLLESLERWNFGKIIVADDDVNPPKSKAKMYEEFLAKLPLEIIHLPEDTGLAAGRNEIVKRTKTKYLLILDDDMLVANSPKPLIEILASIKKLGAVAGLLEEHGRIFAPVANLAQKGEYLIKYTPKSLAFLEYAKYPAILFDMIPNAAILRKKILDDYIWDSHYKIGYEHLDFYWAHKKIGRWQFAITTAVIFRHNPGGDKKYIEMRRKRNRLAASREYFLKKWKMKDVINAAYPFIDTQTSLLRKVSKTIKSNAPVEIAAIVQKIERLVVGD